MSFDTLFSNLAAKLFGTTSSKPGDEADAVDPELVRLAVEAVVDAVDPRLRCISAYTRKLAPGMEATIRHMRSLAKDMEAPLLLTHNAWGSDPMLNALFGNADDISSTIDRSDELRAFFEAPEYAFEDQAYLLLGALRTERNVLAPANVNGQLLQDVAQTTVSVSKHKLIAPAVDFDACRREVGMRILRRLAELALERITTISERTMALEHRKAMLGAQLRMLNLRRNGLQNLAGAAHDDAAEISAIEKELHATVENYIEAKASLATLESRIDHINAVFTAPADFVSYQKIEMRLNRMGYKVTAESDEQASDLSFGELSIGDGLKATVVFVICPRSEMPAKESMSARAARLSL
jgi:hypothetical protein